MKNLNERVEDILEIFKKISEANKVHAKNLQLVALPSIAMNGEILSDIGQLIRDMQERIEELEAANARLREALEDLRFAGLLDGINMSFHQKIDEALEITKENK